MGKIMKQCMLETIQRLYSLSVINHSSTPFFLYKHLKYWGRNRMRKTAQDKHFLCNPKFGESRSSWRKAHTQLLPQGNTFRNLNSTVFDNYVLHILESGEWFCLLASVFTLGCSWDIAISVIEGPFLEAFAAPCCLLTPHTCTCTFPFQLRRLLVWKATP